MKNNFKFSVLLPVYDLEKPEYFNSCLNSILNQTVIPDEVVIAKDGEINNKLAKVIHKYRDNLNIKEVLYSGKDNLSGALKYGLSFCTYNIIARADSDDIYDKKRFENQIKYFKQKPDLSVLGTYVIEFNESINDLNIIRKGFKINGNFSLNNPVHHSSVMFLKNDIVSAGNYKKLEGFEDWYLWLRLRKKGYKIETLQENLCYVRVGNSFYKRRSGLNYIKNEFNAHNVFYKEKLITFINFLSTMIIRTPLRLLPEKVIKFLYYCTRKKQ